MFYKEGLNFTCQRCLYCCSVEPGYVFLSEKDIDNLALHFSLDRETFIHQYCRLVDYGTHYLVSLTEKKNYDCEFLSPDGCTVYEARPVQCRTYPFWRSIVESEEKWNEEGNYCRGINRGRKIEKKEIEAALKKGDENPPYLIFKKKGMK